METCPICHGGHWLIRMVNGRQVGLDPCECWRPEMEQRRIARLMADAGLTQTDLKRWTWESFRPNESVGDASVKAIMAHVVGELKEWAEDPRGWRCLWGTYGSGKTHLLYATAAAAIKAGHSVFVSNAVDLLSVLRGGFDDAAAMAYEERYWTIANVKLLVLDDLGAEKGTEWAEEQFYRLLDYRYRQELAMLLSTNRVLTDADGSANRACGLAPRLLSRLLDGSKAREGFSRVIVVPAGDYRATRRWA